MVSLSDEVMTWQLGLTMLAFLIFARKLSDLLPEPMVRGVGVKAFVP